MSINYNTGDRISVKQLGHSKEGTIVEIKGKRIFAIMDATTTGALSGFSLRNDNTFIAIGYSQDDSSWGGWFRNGDNPNWK